MFLPFFTNKSIRKIVTIHDLLFLDMPFLYSKFERNVLKFTLNDAVNRADAFICISKYTYSRFKNYFPNKKNVEVIYNCLSINKESDALDSRGNDYEKYFILPSNRTPRKNIRNTLLAYKKSLFYKNGYKLLVCGPMDGVEIIGDDNLIRDVGYVDEVELERLYKNSEGLLFFSLGEGFGYPIIEAASYSVPVLAAANTSITELFDGRTDLLCTDYLTIDGISAFLDKYYSSDDMKFQILQVLEKTLRLFSKDIFYEQLLSLYKVK
jgi:glycosyltransferase involved in cell wall biosynthesis